MIHFSNELLDYCLNFSDPLPPLCGEISDYTKSNVTLPQMLSHPLINSLMHFFLRSQQGKRVLEIGTFTGQATLGIASLLPPDGEITTLDISPERTDVAKLFWAKAPLEVQAKINLKIGPALQEIQNLTPYYDLIFIDADKVNYVNYLKSTLPLLHPRGTIFIDNTLWKGNVINPLFKDKETRAIRELALFLKEKQNELHSLLLPIHDGVFLVQKRGSNN